MGSIADRGFRGKSTIWNSTGDVINSQLTNETFEINKVALFESLWGNLTSDIALAYAGNYTINATFDSQELSISHNMTTDENVFDFFEFVVDTCTYNGIGVWFIE